MSEQPERAKAGPEDVFKILKCMTPEKLRAHKRTIENLGPGDEWRFLFSWKVEDSECNAIMNYLTAGLPSDFEICGIPNGPDWAVSISKKKPIEYE